MSGHSKWSQIKRQKGVKDVKRSGVFSKLAKAIAVAARSGGNPDDNFKLRLTIEKAREANMPNENIERAIKRGTGESNEGTIDEVTYEGYGPGGAAFIIQTLTDNKNRTVSDIRRILSVHGGNIGNAGSVAWQFAQKGVVRISRENLGAVDKSALELTLIDAGAEDIHEQEEGITVVVPPHDMEKLKQAIGRQNIPLASSDIELVPTTLLELNEAQKQQTLTMIEELEEHDDVDAVFTNAHV